MFIDRTTLGQKLTILEHLTEDEVSDPNVLNDIQKALPDVQEVSRERNRYIHDQWIFRPDDIPEGKIGRAKLDIAQDGGLSIDTTELTIEELYKFLNRIGEFQKQFAGFVNRLHKNNSKKAEQKDPCD